MPRQARIDATGALQHILVRGIERRKLFLDERDRDAFLERLGRILQDAATPCHGWALLPTHAQRLLQTGRVPVATVVGRLLPGDAVTFNRRHRRHGHRVQNRYKSVVVEEELYLLDRVRYLHVTPLRAKGVADRRALERCAEWET